MNSWVKFAKFDNSVIDLWSVLFGGFEDGSLEKKKRHLDNQTTCISSTGGAQQHVEEPLMATTVVAPLPPAGCQPGCSLPLGNILVLEQHQSANEVSLDSALVARSYFNISLHWDCLQSRQVLFLHCLPVPPSKDAPSTLLLPFHSIDVAISRAASAFSPHFDPTIQPPRGDSQLNTAFLHLSLRY